MLTATSYGADATTFPLNFRRQGLLWFFQSLTVGYTLVRQRATSLQLCGSPSLACSLPYTFRYIFVNACALSKPRARATALAFIVAFACCHVCLYCMIPDFLARPRPNISAEGLHFSAFSFCLLCENSLLQS